MVVCWVRGDEHNKRMISYVVPRSMQIALTPPKTNEITVGNAWPLPHAIDQKDLLIVQLKKLVKSKFSLCTNFVQFKIVSSLSPSGALLFQGKGVNVGAARLKFRQTLGKIKADQKQHPTCFVSYDRSSPKQEEWVKQFVDDLKATGVQVHFEAEDYLVADKISDSARKILSHKACKVILVGTKTYRDHLTQVGPHRVKDGFKEISTLFRDNPSRVFPILLDGTDTTSFPNIITTKECKISYTDFRAFIDKVRIENSDDNYFTLFFMILRGMFPKSEHNYFTKLIDRHKSCNPTHDPLRETMLDLVSGSGKAFVHLSDEYKRDMEIVDTAAKNYPKALKYVQSITPRQFRNEIEAMFVESLQEIAKASPSTPKVFLSYAWGSLKHERWVQRFKVYLDRAGVSTYFDKDMNMATGELEKFTARIAEKDAKIILIGTKNLVNKLNKQGKYHVVKDEINKISRVSKDNVLPILLQGDFRKSFPYFIKKKAEYFDFRDFRKQDIAEQFNDKNYFTRFFEVLKKLYNSPKTDSLLDRKNEELQSHRLRKHPLYSRYYGALIERKKAAVLELVT